MIDKNQKNIEKSQRFHIQVLNRSEEFYCDEELSLLRGMEKENRNCIDVGCRGGGCGLCKIHVVEGQFQSKRMSRNHITESEEAEGVVLACRIFPLSDMKILSDMSRIRTTSYAPAKSGTK